jgi:hypothetical protein
MACENYNTCIAIKMVQSISLTTAIKRIREMYCDEQNGKYCDYKAQLKDIQEGRMKMFSKR